MDLRLEQKLDALPQAPGCYLMKDRAGGIIYVGKAVNLRARVRSYFTKADTRAFVQQLDTLLGDIEVLITRTEKEALLLENELIKKHQPRFNVMLRDDKNFISLRLDVQQPYPRLEVVRRRRRDGARYFGPYSSASSIRETLRVVNRYFRLRTCSDSVMSNRRRPCLQYQIKRCPGPCVFGVPAEEYRRSIEDVTLFLQGRTDELTEHLRERMKTAARELRFEEAAALRDQVIAVERSLEKQRAVAGAQVDQDVFGLFREGPQLVIQVLFVRQGKLLGGRHFPFSGQELPDDEVLAQFVGQFYDGEAVIPHEVILPVELEDAATREEWLGEKRGTRVHLVVPQRGDKLRLVAMARENAEHQLREWQRHHASSEETLERLRRRLHLSRLPLRIECFDNSHLQGTLSVGSKVAFTEGEPDKARYRHFKVRTAAGNDDFQMMYEVLSRRLARGREEDDLPDLIVIDGGKGQLNVARAVLKEQGLTERVDLCALAKGRVVDDEALFASRQGFQPEEARSEPAQALTAESDGAPSQGAAELEAPVEANAAEEAPPGEASPKKGRSRNPGRWKKDAVERSPERVFLPGQKNPVVLRPNSAELFLLQRLRDEAHRFAITFQRKLRRAANFRSVLREIPGIGETRQRALLRHFGSLRRIREASVEELAQADGFSAVLAEEVFRFFHRPGREEVLPAATDAAAEAEEMAIADAGLEEIEELTEEAEPEENERVVEEIAEELRA